jgi:outer membrane receptor protein involved in Fe transport
LDFSDDALVGAIGAVFSLREDLNLVASYGTGFRAPNIVERLFNGPTPEGIGYQLLNPDLKSEQSANIDLGLKFQRRNAYAELFFFRNDIDDGIIQYFLSDEEIAELPQEVQDEIAASGANLVVQQRNLDTLRYEGIELAAGYRSDMGLAVGGNYTHLDGQRRDRGNPPTGDALADKINAWIRYEPPMSRFWVEYRVRHNGSQPSTVDPNEPIPPVGDTIPSFTVHTLAGGVLLFQGARQEHVLNLMVDNLTNELYAEFSNATFFRPQPKRSFVANYRFAF